MNLYSAGVAESAADVLIGVNLEEHVAVDDGEYDSDGEEDNGGDADD